MRVVLASCAQFGLKLNGFFAKEENRNTKGYRNRAITLLAALARIDTTAAVA